MPKLSNDQLIPYQKNRLTDSYYEQTCFDHLHIEQCGERLHLSSCKFDHCIFSKCNLERFDGMDLLFDHCDLSNLDLSHAASSSTVAWLAPISPIPLFAIRPFKIAAQPTSTAPAHPSSNVLLFNAIYPTALLTIVSSSISSFRNAIWISVNFIIQKWIVSIFLPVPSKEFSFHWIPSKEWKSIRNRRSHWSLCSASKLFNIMRPTILLYRHWSSVWAARSICAINRITKNPLSLIYSQS